MATAQSYDDWKLASPPESPDALAKARDTAWLERALHEANHAANALGCEGDNLTPDEFLRARRGEIQQNCDRCGGKVTWVLRDPKTGMRDEAGIPCWHCERCRGK